MSWGWETSDRGCPSRAPIERGRAIAVDFALGRLFGCDRQDGPTLQQTGAGPIFAFLYFPRFSVNPSLA